MRVCSAFIAVIGMFSLSIRTAAAQPEEAPPPKAVTGSFPSASDADAWANLPRANTPLPPWAKMLVGPLPKTTAKMLELDYFHREKNPLGPELAGILRWNVADALDSKFGRDSAKDDLKRARISLRWIERPNNLELVGPDIRVAIDFARKLTLEGHAITDREFAELLKQFGPEKVTAIVHTVAYANFHNRIVLGLGAVGDPVPPVDAKFDMEKFAQIVPPKRPTLDELNAVPANGLSVRVEWSKADADTVSRTLEAQKDRTLRIPLPSKERFADMVGREKEQAERIVWMTVSAGYQRDMTRAWFAPMNAFYEEAKPDRVFSNSVFWVVTRTNDCFY